MHIEQIGKKIQGKFNVNGKSEESALLKYYYINHKNKLENLAYNIIFIEKPNFRSLDYKKCPWIKNLEAKINLSRTMYSDIM